MSPSRGSRNQQGRDYEDDGRGGDYGESSRGRGGYGQEYGGGRQQRHYYDDGRHYTYEPTEEQLRAMRRNIEIARRVWMNMSPEERSAVMPGGPEGPEPSPELMEARRRNVRIAREAWMDMDPEERARRMPGGGDYEPSGRRSRRGGYDYE